jgi:hypothetical protein
MELFQPWHLIILLVISGLYAVLFVVPLYLIADKAGLNKWIALLALITPIGFIALYYIALSKWHPKSE